MDKIKINSQDIYKLDGVDRYICDNSLDLSGFFSEYLKENQNEDATDSEFRQRLEGKSKAIFFVGFRNTGKTAYLKKYFNIENNSPYIQHKTGQMIIPVLNVGNIEGIISSEMVLDSIRGVCEKISLEYPSARAFYEEEEIKKFYQFILNTQAASLPELRFQEECSMTESEQKKAKIAKMQEQKKLSYYVMKFKFTVKNYCSDLKTIIFLIDNLNNISAEYTEIKKIINEYLDVFEYLKGDSKIKVYVVISVRPVAFRQLKTDERINAYIQMNNVIRKEHEIDSARLFEKIGELSQEDITVDSETASYGSNLYQLGIKFKYKYSNMIKQLCFYDVDLIIKAYERILKNETWIKNGNFRFSAGNITPKGWSFNNITCIRALACGNKKLYRNMVKEKNAEALDCLIPNLLYNTEEQNYGVYILYTIKFFLRNFNAEMEYGDSYIVLKDYRDIFLEIFGKNSEQKIKDVISYLYQCEILRKSIADNNDAKDSFGENVYREKIGWESKMYITSRGRKLWDMLKDDSLLLELCREDVYRERFLPEDCMKSSYDLMTEGKQDVLFNDLLFIINQVFEEELKYLKEVCKKKKQDLFVTAFGKSPLSLILLEGVSKSIQYSGYRDLIRSDKEKFQMYIKKTWYEILEISV